MMFMTAVRDARKSPGQAGRRGRAALRAALLALLFAASPGAAQTGRFEFVAIGDMPYTVPATTRASST